MRNNGLLARDDAWRRGLIERLDAIEEAAAAEAQPSPTRAVTRPAPTVRPAAGRLVQRLAAAPVPSAKPADEPLAFEDLQRSLAEALAPQPAPLPAPLNVEAALSAVTSELGRIAFGTKVADQARRDAPTPAPLSAVSMHVGRVAVTPHDEVLVLPHAIMPGRPDVPRELARSGRRYSTIATMSVAAGAALAVLGVGALGYRAVPSLYADAAALRRPAPASMVAGPGRFEAHFRQAPVDAHAAPASVAEVAAVDAPAPAATAEDDASAGATGEGAMAPMQIMAMMPVEPGAAPLPPIPKIPGAAPSRRPAKADAPAVVKRQPPAVARKAPAEPAKKAAPAPTQVAVEAPALRPVPRAPRPSGVFTLGGPSPAAIGVPSQEYRANIPAGPPAWLPKPDQ